MGTVVVEATMKEVKTQGKRPIPPKLATIRGNEVPTTVWSIAAVNSPSSVPAITTTFVRVLIWEMELTPSGTTAATLRLHPRHLLRLLRVEGVRQVAQGEHQPLQLRVRQAVHHLVHAGAGATLQLFHRAVALRAEVVPDQAPVPVVRLPPDQPLAHQPVDDAGERGRRDLEALRQRAGRGAVLRPKLEEDAQLRQPQLDPRLQVARVGAGDSAPEQVEGLLAEGLPVDGHNACILGKYFSDVN